MDTKTVKKKQVQPKTHAGKTKAVVAARRRKIIKSIIEGKTQKQAGIAAGLKAENVESQVCNILKEPQTRATFSHIMETAGLTNEFLSNKIRSLCDFSKKQVVKGKDADTVIEVADGQVQLGTVKLVTQLKGHLVDKVEHGASESLLGISGDIDRAARLIFLLEKAEKRAKKAGK